MVLWNQMKFSRISEKCAHSVFYLFLSSCASASVMQHHNHIVYISFSIFYSISQLTAPQNNNVQMILSWNNLAVADDCNFQFNFFLFSVLYAVVWSSIWFKVHNKRMPTNCKYMQYSVTLKIIVSLGIGEREVHL